MRSAVRRLEFFLVTLWAALTINFCLPRLMPGSPAEAMIAHMRGGQVSPANLRAMEIAFGAGESGSLFSQYLTYMADMVKGRFGISVLFFPVPVKDVVMSALPWTVGLVGVTTVIAFMLGTILGMIAAWRRGGVTDSVVLPASLVVSAFPYFWLGLIVIYFFAVKLAWLPSGFGYDVSSGQTPSFSLWFVGQVLYHGILPGATIVLVSVGGWLLLMRNNMLGTLSEDYVRMGKAKGLSARRVMTAYAARNAILPSMTGFAMAMGFVVSGALLTEVVFNYPGLGYLLFQAVTSQDYPLMQAIFFMITIAVLVAVLIADIVNAVLDPRSRESR